MQAITTLKALAAAQQDGRLVLLHNRDWALYEVTSVTGVKAHLQPVAQAGFSTPRLCWDKSGEVQDYFDFHGPYGPKDIGPAYIVASDGDEPGLIDDLDGEPLLIVEADIVGFAKITLVIDRLGEWAVAGNTDKAKLHFLGSNGQPLCGTTLSAYKENPDRWNPWNQYAVPADTRESRFVPVFGLGLNIEDARTELPPAGPGRKARPRPSPCAKCTRKNGLR